MIKSFKHKGLENFFLDGSTKGIQAMLAVRLTAILATLDSMESLDALQHAPSYRLHPLKGDMKGLWAITVQANWRVTFKFDTKNADVYIVDYLDYH